MGSSTWSPEKLLALVEGTLVSGRDLTGEAIALPGWLTAGADGEYGATAEEMLETVHPDDRVQIVETYGNSLNSPGLLITTEVRSTLFGSPQMVAFTMVNLADDPEIGGLVATLRLTGAPADGDFDLPSTTDQKPVQWIILTVDPSAVIQTVEGNTVDFIGYRHDELLGHVPAQFVTPDNLTASIRMWRTLRDNPGGTFTSRRQWIRKDGSVVWIETSYAHRTDPPPGEGSIILVMWDITDKLAAEAALAQREAELERLAEDFRALADEVPVVVFRCSTEGRVTFHNAVWERILAERSDVARIHDLFDDQARRELSEALQRAAATGTAERTRLELADRDGTTTWRVGLRPLPDADGPTSFIGSLEDVTSTVRLRAEASSDPLTGLLNRAATEAELNQARRDRPHHTLVVFIDLDRFKLVNDTWGHLAGDRVLIEVAQRLANSARAEDAVGRWGGDEFVLIVEAGPTTTESSLVERLREVLETPIELGEDRWVPSASIGVVRPKPDEAVEEIITRADRAMFRSKRAGR